MNILKNKGLWGATIGAIVAIIWSALDGTAVLLLIGLAAAGWLIGMVFQRPDVLIAWLQRLQER